MYSPYWLCHPSLAFTHPSPHPKSAQWISFHLLRQTVSPLLRNCPKYLLRNIHFSHSLLAYGYKLVIFTVMSNILLWWRSSAPSRNSHQNILAVPYACLTEPHICSWVSLPAVEPSLHLCSGSVFRQAPFFPLKTVVSLGSSHAPVDPTTSILLWRHCDLHQDLFTTPAPPYATTDVFEQYSQSILPGSEFCRIPHVFYRFFFKCWIPWLSKLGDSKLLFLKVWSLDQQYQHCLVSSEKYGNLALSKTRILTKPPDESYAH